MCDFAILTRLVKILFKICSRFLKFRFKILTRATKRDILRSVARRRPNARSVRGRQSKNYETQKGGVAKQRERLKSL